MASVPKKRVSGVDRTGEEIRLSAMSQTGRLRHRKRTAVLFAHCVCNSKVIDKRIVCYNNCPKDPFAAMCPDSHFRKASNDPSGVVSILQSSMDENGDAARGYNRHARSNKKRGVRLWPNRRRIRRAVLAMPQRIPLRLCAPTAIFVRHQTTRLMLLP